MVKYILYAGILLGGLLVGCTRKAIKEEYYTIPCRLQNLTKSFIRDFVTDEVAYGSVERFKHSSSSRHKLFTTTDLEIETQKVYGVSVNERRYSRRKNYFIGIKAESDYTGAAFYIVWTNRSTRMDTAHRFMMGTKQMRSVNYFTYVPWEIGECTDSLQSNLDLKAIKTLYPRFAGFYKKVQPDSIVVRYDTTLYASHRLDNPQIYINGDSSHLFFR
jgi:hypothetical protein